MSHTQGKLAVADDGSLGSIILASDQTSIGHTFQRHPIAADVYQTERKENARRLVACWNACEGIPIETLEAVEKDRQFWPIDFDGSSRKGLVTLLGIQNFTVQELKRQVESETRKAIKAQRNALLAALQRIVEWNDRKLDNGQPAETGITQIQLAAAREAIASATGIAP